MPSFVVLSHTFSKSQSGQDHFDLMIEYDGHLLTWRIQQWPPSSEMQVAIELPPHRLAYLEYEGPVSGNRGTVSQVARGSCQFVSRDVSNIEIQFDSESASGVLRLRRDTNNDSSDGWLLWMIPDAEAKRKS